MLPINDLINFAETHKDARANLEEKIVVASDDEVASLIQDLSNSGNLCTLITVVPSHDPTLPDEDTRQAMDRLLFFVVKKHDTTSGNTSKLNNFAICQDEIKALLNKILDYKDNPIGNCLFADVDYSSISITPVSNYFNQNGYLLQLSTRTDL